MHVSTQRRPCMWLRAIPMAQVTAESGCASFPGAVPALQGVTVGADMTRPCCWADLLVQVPSNQAKMES